MKSVLLPKEQTKDEAFDPSKCVITLAQIESMITDAESRRDRLEAELSDAGGGIVMKGSVGYTVQALDNMLTRINGKIAVLKELRHMAYIAGGYLKE